MNGLPHTSHRGGGESGSRVHERQTGAGASATYSVASQVASCGPPRIGASPNSIITSAMPWHAIALRIATPGAGRWIFGAACGLAEQQLVVVLAFALRQHGGRWESSAASSAGIFTTNRTAPRHWLTSRPARWALSSADSGGRTPSRRAHSSRWAIVWQQQALQQCSAVPQPQGHDSQGKRSSSAIEGRVTIDTHVSGNGAPLATTTV